MTFSDSNSNQYDILVEDKDLKSAFHSNIKENLHSIDEADELNYQSNSTKVRDISSQKKYTESSNKQKSDGIYGKFDEKNNKENEKNIIKEIDAFNPSLLSKKYTFSNESEVRLDSIEKSNNFDSEKWLDIS